MSDDGAIYGSVPVIDGEEITDRRMQIEQRDKVKSMVPVRTSEMPHWVRHLEQMGANALVQTDVSDKMRKVWVVIEELMANPHPKTKSNGVKLATKMIEEWGKMFERMIAIRKAQVETGVAAVQGMTAEAALHLIHQTLTGKGEQ